MRSVYLSFGRASNATCPKMKSSKAEFHFVGGILLASISTLFGLVMAELAVRYYIFGSRSFSYELMSSYQTFGRSGLLKASDDSEILFEFKPNLDTIQHMAVFKTNSKGLRDKEYALKKPDDVYRIAVIGDSYTAAPGISIEATYHSLIEDELNRPENAHGKKVEVINFAVHGYYLSQSVATLKKKALAYDPDMVILGYCAYNDHDIPPADKFKPPYQVKKKRNGFFASYLVKLIKHYFSSRAYQANGPRRISEAEVAYLKENFNELGSLSLEQRIPVVVSYLDNYPSDSGFVKSLSEEHGLNFIDVSSEFSHEDFKNNRIFLIDGHPNENAHKKFAAVIIKAVQEIANLN